MVKKNIIGSQLFLQRKFFFISFFIMICQLGFSQSDTLQIDSVQVVETDSLLEEQHHQKNVLIFHADSLRSADSLQQVAILKEISELRSRDKKKKEELQARLDSLKAATELNKVLVKRQIDSLRTHTIGVPVVYFGDTLFSIFSKIGPFKPSDRVENIVQKLERIENDDKFNVDDIQIFPGTESHDIVYKDLIILSVTDRDAFWLNKSRTEVAEFFTSAIKKSITNHIQSTGFIQNLKRIGLLIFTIFGFLITVYYLDKGFTWLNNYLLLKGKKYMKGLMLRNYEFLSAKREEQVLTWLLKIIKWITISIVIYLILPIIFSIFPATKGIASMLIGYVLSPIKMFGESFLGYIPEMITIIVIITITNYFIKFLKFLASEIQHGKLVISGFYAEWASPTFNLLRIIVYAFSFIIIFPYLPGSDSPIFQGVSVFLGVLFSLGSSSAISNIIAGLVITYMRPFKNGDRVKIGEVVGDVIDKTMLVTRIRTIDNEDVTIPNSAILNGSTINYSSSAKDLGLILKTTITIGYDVSWRQVHELLINSALKTSHIKTEPTPFVLQTSLDDFYVSYQIKAYTEQAGMAAKIYSELHANIQDAFNSAGIEIMSPHYRGNRDGSASTIPNEGFSNE